MTLGRLRARERVPALREAVENGTDIFLRAVRAIARRALEGVDDGQVP
jgi:hypothetical protein